MVFRLSIIHDLILAFRSRRLLMFIIPDSSLTYTTLCFSSISEKSTDSLVKVLFFILLILFY